MNLLIKQKQTDRLEESTYGYQGERVAERNRQGVWHGHVYTTVFKIDNQEGPTV